MHHAKYLATNAIILQSTQCPDCITTMNHNNIGTPSGNNHLHNIIRTLLFWGHEVEIEYPSFYYYWYVSLMLYPNFQYSITLCLCIFGLQAAGFLPLTSIAKLCTGCMLKKGSCFWLQIKDTSLPLTLNFTFTNTNINRSDLTIVFKCFVNLLLLDSLWKMTQPNSAAAY